jgi:signal peptidase I
MVDSNIKTKSKEININTRKRRLVVKYIIHFVLLLFIAIITLVEINRISIFQKVFGSLIKALEGAGVIVYSISLGIILLYHLIMLIYVFFSYLEDKDWYTKLDKIDKKIDLITFTFKTLSYLLFIMIFISTPCRVVGDSMNPTFETGQNIMCGNYFFSSPNKDDVIIFDARNENHQIDDVFYIKRVVAKPGSKIHFDFDTYDIYVDDVKIETLSINEIRKINNSIDLADEENDYVVPKNKYLVFGDNRERSQDSRSFGYIDNNQIFGKVFLRFFPFDKFKFF